MYDFKKILNKFKINRYFILFLGVCLIAGYLKEALLLFLFVMLHELCHVIIAVILGFKISSIEIFPFGGVAVIDKLDGSGVFKEVMISIAGPAFNIFTALIILSLNQAGVYMPDFRYIMNINIALALFNLMPGLPLDGGRIVRAVLGYFIGFKKATKAAVVLGKIVSIFLLILGITAYLYGDINLSLLIIPLFVFVFAGKEENILMYTIIRNVINKSHYLKKEGVIETLEVCGFEDVPTREILRYFDLNKYHMIIVINANMEVRAVLTENQAFEGMSLYGSDITLGQLCEKYKK